MRLLIAAAIAGGAAVPVFGQETPVAPVGEYLPWPADSGVLANPGAFSAQLHTETVSVEDGAWIRVYFGDVVLGHGSFLRITSKLDNDVQILDAGALEMWGDSTAYFNGDTVLIDVVAGPGTTNRLVIEQIATQIGGVPQELGDAGECGICGISDDRVPSSETYTGRLLPAGCTASVWNEQSCLVSAGHCITGDEIIQFNVPDSLANCQIVHPPSAEQFPIIDQLSVNGGVGNDWAVMTSGTNTLGETAFERYGELRPIATTPAGVGQACTLTGYGVDTTCTRSQTQQTADGSVTQVLSDHYRFNIDLRGGNSGSALISNDEIIGIATHCPCPNYATRIDLAAFEEARDNLCESSLAFAFPDGLPDVVDPAGSTTFPVVISGDLGDPEPGTGTLHYSINGGSFTTAAMNETAPNEYEASFPATDCGDRIDFYFSALTTVGSTVFSPQAAPSDTYLTFAGLGAIVEFEDDFEADEGWSISGGASGGVWERAVPAVPADCDRDTPESDADGSGQCYVTDDNPDACNSDVDGGETILTSPVLDATGDKIVSYWRWYSNSSGVGAFEDVFTVEVSGNGGADWEPLEMVGPTGPEVQGGWFERSFLVSDAVGSTSQFRIRFIAADEGGGSIVEGAVDGVRLWEVDCAANACPWDCADPPDGTVGINDFLALLAQWGMAGSCDTDGGGVGINDFLELLANWGGCP